MWGSIEKPMALNKFGEMLRAAGYTQKCLHNGKKGYIVKVSENMTDRQYQEIQELKDAAGAACTF